MFVIYAWIYTPSISIVTLKGSVDVGSVLPWLSVTEAGEPLLADCN